MKIDLHTHSYCSDGSLSPADLLDRARQASLDMLSITDHDLVEAYAELPQSAELPLVVPGIELSAQWRRRSIHIVGLDIELDSGALQQMIGRQRAAREDRMVKIVQRLQKLGLTVDLEALSREHQSGMLGRPQLAAYLVESGQAASEQQAFKKYLGRGKPGDVHGLWPEVAEIVRTIGLAGGQAVLAHPLKYRLTRTKMKELLTDFVAAGGSAMEVGSGRQVPADTRYLAELCREFDLHASLGSDFHRPSEFSAGPGQLVAMPAGLKPVWELFDLNPARYA